MEIFRCLKLADNEASITAHIEYNTKLELSLIIRVLCDTPEFVKLPQKAKTLTELLFHTRMHVVEILGFITSREISPRSSAKIELLKIYAQYLSKESRYRTCARHLSEFT